MLELIGVKKTFNPGTVNAKTALAGIDLHLKEGDFVTVIGGNGAGKSTTLNAIAGSWPIDEGKIIIGGNDVTHMPEHRRAQFLGRVFQDPMLGTAANMEIEENLALAARRGKARSLRWRITDAERKQYRELLSTLELGLEDRMTVKVGLAQAPCSASARSLRLVLVQGVTTSPSNSANFAACSASSSA